MRGWKGMVGGVKTVALRGADDERADGRWPSLRVRWVFAVMKNRPIILKSSIEDFGYLL